MKPKLFYIAILTQILITSFLVPCVPCSSTLHPETYKNPRFWDGETSPPWCFIYQETSNSCGPASVEILLNYLDYSPVPNQTELANEMNTDIHSCTHPKYMCIPFERRGFTDHYNTTLSTIFEPAFENLKANISENFPAIISTWYDSSHTFGHFRVVTGYNASGVFVHDPWDGPNIFLNESTFQDLWSYDSFWAIIILDQPYFDVTIKIRDVFGLPVSGANITLWDITVKHKLTGSDGTAIFGNLSISNYTLDLSYRFQHVREAMAITKPTAKNYTVYLSNFFIIIVVSTGIIVVAMVMFIRRAHAKPSNTTRFLKKDNRSSKDTHSKKS